MGKSEVVYSDFSLWHNNMYIKVECIDCSASATSSMVVGLQYIYTLTLGIWAIKLLKVSNCHDTSNNFQDCNNNNIDHRMIIH